MTNAALSNRNPAGPAPRKLWARLVLLFLAISLGTAGALWLRDSALRQWERHREDRPLRVLWQNGVRQARLLRPRLSGFGYAAYRTFAPALPRDWNTLQRRVTRGQTEGERGAEQLVSEAKLRLIGSTGSVDSDVAALREALVRLEAATVEPDAPAAVWSDLAAVRLSLAEAEGEPYLNLGALDAAERAVKLDDQLPEALFNRALGLESLGLWQAAKEAWERYLRIDGATGWAEEARGYLTRLRLPDPEGWPQENLRQAARSGNQERVVELVRSFLSPSRRLLEEKILPDWGTARLAGAASATEAAALLTEARAIAAAYSDVTRDPLYRDTVAEIDQAAGGRLDELAMAHRDFGLAVEAIDQAEDIGHAEDLLDAAVGRLENDPFARRAELKLAIVDERKGHRDDEVARLAGLRDELRESGNLLGESYWVEGLSLVRKGQLAQANEAYDHAEESFQAVGETEGVVGIQNLKAERLDLIGQTSEVWKELAPLWSQVAEIRQARRLYLIYSNAAFSAKSAGYPNLALLFMKEAASWAETMVQSRVEAHIWKADFLCCGLRDDDVHGELNLAYAQIPSIPNEHQRSFLQARAQEIEGEMLLESDPKAARAHLESSLALNGNESQSWGKRALLHLGWASRKEKDLRQAAAYLQRSVELTESERKDLKEGERVAILEQAGDAFEELISLELEARSPEKAFDWQEKRAARALFDRFVEHGTPANLLATAELQNQWPAGRTLIEYAFVQGRLHAWVLSASGIHAAELGPSEKELSTQIRQWVTDIEREVPESRIEDEGRSLYDKLISPLIPFVPAGTDWVIVADGPLRDLPFAALYDGQQFLIEGRGLAMAPSANLYLCADRRNRGPIAVGPASPLILGNPIIDQKLFPWLKALPAATDEANALGRLYKAHPFLGKDASRQLFLKEAPGHDLLQISSHAWLHPLAPMSSSLVLSGGELPVREIAGLDLHKTRLAVLSACRTAGAPDRSGEAVESLAHAFLAAGVPGVVASLWDVEDGPTSELMLEFHRQLSQSGNARKALRNAQIKLLHPKKRSLGRPAVWAAFQLVGEAAWNPHVAQPKGGR